MVEKLNTLIREAILPEDDLIAQHFYQLWLDNDVSSDKILTDWLDITLQFINNARQELAFKSFVAEIEGKVVGSASGQLFAGLYPQPFISEYRQYGYIWNVYVEPSYRHQGIATKLTHQTINYLQSIGCTRVILNASPSGKPVYQRLGFEVGNEMRLNLF